MSQLLGEKIRSLRQAKGLTQFVLAQQVGLSAHTHIGKVESGRDVPSLDLIVRIAIVLQVPIDYLLRDTISIHEVGMPAAIPQSTILPESFGQKLQLLRLRHNMSQTDLARALSLKHRGYISNLEAGRKLPSIDLVLVIADLFGVTTDDLLRPSHSAEQG